MNAPLTRAELNLMRAGAFKDGFVLDGYIDHASCTLTYCAFRWRRGGDRPDVWEISTRLPSFPGDDYHIYHRDFAVTDDFGNLVRVPS